MIEGDSQSNPGLQGRSVSEGEREDQYYRELLARVDNAIVDGQDGDDGPARAGCRVCLRRSANCTVIAAAVAAEAGSTIRVAFAGLVERYFGSGNNERSDVDGMSHSVGEQASNQRNLFGGRVGNVRSNGAHIPLNEAGTSSSDGTGYDI